MGIKTYTPPPPNKIKLRKDDEVKVISGTDKGKTGRVLHVDRKGKIVPAAGEDGVEITKLPVVQRTPIANVAMVLSHSNELPMLALCDALVDPAERRSGVERGRARRGARGGARAERGGGLRRPRDRERARGSRRQRRGGRR